MAHQENNIIKQSQKVGEYHPMDSIHNTLVMTRIG